MAETPFFSRSVSEFVLNKPRTEYTIYPDIIWNYEALKNEVQAEPVSVAITVEMNGNRTVTEFAFLQYIPQSIHLLVHRPFSLTLIA